MRVRRGMTLVELMVVVAIVGVMTALAMASITAATRVGRVNGASTSLATMLTNARSRALTEHCTYVLQLNGPTYDASAAPLDVRRRPNTALLFRKNKCGSTVGAYEPTPVPLDQDHLVEDMELATFTIDLRFPTSVVAGGLLGSGSVSIAWLGNGSSQRTVYSDPTASGTSSDTGFASGALLPITVTPYGMTSNPPSRVVSVNPAGPSKAL
jgi:prepilin-type N-terminal cleavage/methylation domain-containing protein